MLRNSTAFQPFCKQLGGAGSTLLCNDRLPDLRNRYAEPLVTMAAVSYPWLCIRRTFCVRRCLSAVPRYGGNTTAAFASIH
jgi:hypothetical protein